MPRPRSLTAAQVAAAALVVLDRDGAAALSMRAVAVELGTSAMALYRYVDGRTHLERQVVEHVLATVELDLPARLTWTERVVVLMERMRSAVADHPAALPLFIAHRHAVPASLRWIETMLGVLTEAGFTGEERVVAQRALVSYLLGALQLEHLGPLPGTGTTTMASLPTAEFPHLAETAREARRIAPADEFRRGLDVLLRGLTDAAEGGNSYGAAGRRRAGEPAT